MAAEKFTTFDYLLNAMLDAARHEHPAEHGYGEKRRKLYEHVRELERKAAAYDALRAAGATACVAASPAPRNDWSVARDCAACGRMATPGGPCQRAAGVGEVRDPGAANHPSQQSVPEGPQCPLGPILPRGVDELLEGQP